MPAPKLLKKMTYSDGRKNHKGFAYNARVLGATPPYSAEDVQRVRDFINKPRTTTGASAPNDAFLNDYPPVPGFEDVNVNLIRENAKGKNAFLPDEIVAEERLKAQRLKAQQQAQQAQQQAQQPKPQAPRPNAPTPQELNGRVRGFVSGNPELNNPNQVMLPNGKVVSRPNPDLTIEQAQQMVQDALVNKVRPDTYAANLAFGQILTKQEQIDAQNAMRQAAIDAMTRSGIFDRMPTLSQDILRRAAGTTAEVNIAINQGQRPAPTPTPTPAPSPSQPSQPRPAPAPAPSPSPSPTGKPGTLYTGKNTDAMKEAHRNKGYDSGKIGAAKARSNGDVNTFRAELGKEGFSPSQTNDIVNIHTVK